MEHMEAKKIHTFTAIQLLLFGILYTVKSIKSVAIAFPVIIAACIPIRLYVLPKIFTDGELTVLDGEDSEIEEWVQNKDIDLERLESDSC